MVSFDPLRTPEQIRIDEAAAANRKAAVDEYEHNARASEIRTTKALLLLDLVEIDANLTSHRHEALDMAEEFSRLSKYLHARAIGAAVDRKDRPFSPMPTTEDADRLDFDIFHLECERSRLRELAVRAGLSRQGAGAW